MEKEKKRRNFFGRLIVFLLTVLAWIGVLAMVMSVLSSYIDPEKFVWASFFGLAFWEIVLFNALVLVLLIMMWSRRAWVAVLALLIAIPGLLRAYSHGKSSEDGVFRVMSYNVQVFRDINDEQKSKMDVALGIVDMVREHRPDVLCIQEFSLFNQRMRRHDCINLLGEMMEMPYNYSHQKANFLGNVIYSRYPISAVDDTTHFGEENDYGAVAQVDAGDKGKFIVICSHLQSFSLTKDEIHVFSEPGNKKEEVQEYGKTIVDKLKNAYQKRSRQVKQMLADIPQDGRPILFCGDLNDTPISYTYHRIKLAGFTDGFVVAGRGIGHTYAGKLPLLRIDYVWGNEGIEICAFKRIRFKGSDHYPVMMDFNLRHGF